MSVGLPFWLLLGTQKVTIKNNQFYKETKTRKQKKGNSAVKEDERKREEKKVAESVEKEKKTE